MYMVAALLITLREGLEAALIIGNALGFLQRVGMQSRQREVWWGVLFAVIVSVIAGFGLHSLGVAFEGRGEEIFKGIAMIVAEGVLTWMQVSGKNMQKELVVFQKVIWL
jgi:high-affinity iron transporter